VKIAKNVKKRQKSSKNVKKCHFLAKKRVFLVFFGVFGQKMPFFGFFAENPKNTIFAFQTRIWVHISGSFCVFVGLAFGRLTMDPLGGQF